MEFTSQAGNPSQLRILVGVDGSASSQAALGWALRQAKLAGGLVEAVIAWHYPAAYGWDAAGIDADFEGGARQVLAEALAAFTADPEVSVTPLVTEGYPAEVLLQAAKGADLLVVGRRGHGGLTSALLGSVSLNCVLHARCPVLVMEQPGEPRRPE